MRADKKKWKSFRAFRFASLILFLFYILSSQYLVPLNNWKEIFPFFHWSLFSEVSPEQSIYAITLEMDEGGRECFLPDCFLGKKSKLRSVISTEFFYLVRSLGIEMETRGETELARQLERKINLRLSREVELPVTYKVYRYNIDPVRFDRYREIENKTLLLSGTLNNAQP